MDWTAHFEMGRQAATGQWRPSPQVEQVPAQLPEPSILTPARQQTITQMADSNLPILTMETVPAITGATPPTPNTQLAMQAMAVAQADMTMERAHEVLSHHTYGGRTATEPELQAAWALYKRELYHDEDASQTARPMLRIDEADQAGGASSSGLPRA